MAVSCCCRLAKALWGEGPGQRLGVGDSRWSPRCDGPGNRPPAGTSHSAGSLARTLMAEPNVPRRLGPAAALLAAMSEHWLGDSVLQRREHQVLAG